MLVVATSFNKSNYRNREPKLRENHLLKIY